MFRQEGDYQVTVVEAVIAEPKFAQPPAFDVALKVQTDDGQADWWRGEVSGSYGKGNCSDRTQAQLTMETLKKLGWQYEGDLAQIGTLVGVKTTAHVEATKSKKDDKMFYNVKYLGEGSMAPKALDPSMVRDRMAALFGQPAAAAAPVTAPPAAPAGNPFATGAKPAAAATAPNPFAKK
jgi:hypothetical protein